MSMNQFRLELQDLAINAEQNWNDVITAIGHQISELQQLTEGVKSIKANQLALIDLKLTQLDIIIGEPVPVATDARPAPPGQTYPPHTP